MPVSDSYHDFLGVSLAEERLRKFGQDGGYLTRQSDVKPGVFILSVIEKGVIVHSPSGAEQKRKVLQTNLR